jgi:hypothetical protein
MQTGFRKTQAAALAVLLVLAISYVAKAQEHAESVHHGFHDATHWVRVFESPERTKWQKPDEVVQALKLKPGRLVGIAAVFSPTKGLPHR